MCFLALLYKVVPEFPVVVAANRDEAKDRPGRPPEQIRPGIWAGLDPRAGGTWLGLNRQARLVAVANRRTETVPDPRARSRGLLCLDMLQEGHGEHLDRLLRQKMAGACYNPFNLLAADASKAWMATFAPGDLELCELDPGVHVVGNTRPGRDHDPKVARGRDLIEPSDDINGVLQTLATVCRDHGAMPDQSDAICVHHLAYGTLASTLIAVHHAHLNQSRYLHAQGNPCKSDYRDCSDLLCDGPTTRPAGN